MSAGNAMSRHAALPSVDDIAGFATVLVSEVVFFLSAIFTATEIRAFPSFSMSGVSRYSGTMRT